MQASELTNLPVLVLNQNYQPLNICRVRRAVLLIYYGKAEMLENGTGVIHSARSIFPVPSVIRLTGLVRRPRPRRRLSRLEVFQRDQYTCQYCGSRTQELTLDHVVPRYRGGEHVWQNVVSACVPCNRHKAGRTPLEAGMKLMRQPVAPRDFFYLPPGYRHAHDKWRKYLPG